ncbi:DUF1190 domain-containing protein [Neomegalonema sp.]|uniref:DUF1190 domain-containing protein n=1 Tax=Neomegalonema sp. TaxID=2039713 RepID=UPI00260DDD1C|nr:DUF1190 domain-containing protein [Neomegalonema sp.]MDD2867913.1 DUF1190 domain-containing protein [Neomegalonema sp.]
MKRSKAVHLLYLGIAATALQGCGEDERPRGYVEAPTVQTVATGEGAYFSMQECLTRFDQALCDESAAEARAEHAQNAPKFSSQESCEAFSGPGMCEAAPQTAGASSGGSSFMPMLMGFMVGRAIGNMSNSGRGYYAGPPAGCDRYGAQPRLNGANCAPPARSGGGAGGAHVGSVFSTSRAGRDAPFSGAAAMTAARAPVGAVADSRVIGSTPATVRAPATTRVVSTPAARPAGTSTTRGGFGSTGQSRGWFSGS